MFRCVWGRSAPDALLRSMLVFDALIYNEDRHFGNFGILWDSHTGKIIAPAPIFDNGLSLLCYASKDDLTDLVAMEEYAKTRTTPYYLSFGEVCAEVMGAKRKEQLRRMIRFRFKRHPSLNFREEHLQALEKLLESRVRKLMAIPTCGKIKQMMLSNSGRIATKDNRYLKIAVWF